MPPELIKLNLGCGPHILDGYVNADIVPLPGVDIVTDLDQAWPWEDESAEYILASHLFEHVNDSILFMREAHRVLAEDGILDIRVPYYRHVFAFTDPTHKRFCTELTWDYWIPGRPLHEAYGPGFGSVKGGPRYACDQMLLVGTEHEELRAILRKLGDDD
jgi:SAM-dependent methyltransferase